MSVEGVKSAANLCDEDSNEPNHCQGLAAEVHECMRVAWRPACRPQRPHRRCGNQQEVGGERPKCRKREQDDTGQQTRDYSPTARVATRRKKTAHVRSVRVH